VHVDEVGKLLWYNGSLLKNKLTNPTEFDIPTNWMIDGTWWKSALREDLSCMSGAPLRAMDGTEKKVLEENVLVAKRVDRRLARTFPEHWGNLDN
jgi:alpha 1,3-mannosyltransferase